MMQVQLKQSEIEAALKGYIAQQGINLTNKSITCTFTAGRKDSGISVELEIEDQAILVPPVPAGGQVTFVPTSPIIALQAETIELAEGVPVVTPTTSSLFA
jgi:hypothetical protein